MNKRTKAIATMAIASVISVDDSIEIESVLYEKDTQIVREMWGLVPETQAHRNGAWRKQVKVADAVIAPKGSLKGFIIHNTTTGKSFPEGLTCLTFNKWLRKV